MYYAGSTRWPRVDRAGAPSAAAGARQLRWSHVATYVALVGLAATFLAPLVWMISTSLKTGPQAIATPPVWLPRADVWGNYPEALSRIDFPIALRNSLIYALPRSSGPSSRAASSPTASPGSAGRDATSSS